MTASRWRAAMTLAAWVALLVVSLTWLVGQQSTSSAAPAGGLDPTVFTMTVVRVVVLALGTYLSGVTALVLVVRLLHLPRAVAAAAERLAPSALRHLVQTAVGVAMTTVASSSPALASTPGAAPAVAARAEGERANPPIDAPVVMHRLADVDESAPTEAATTAPTSSGPATRIVQPGDHFWSIAERHLGVVRNRPVSDAEIDPFWRALMAANRDLTPDPDLLVPGQVVRIPDVS